jgi:hypothetical protein
MLNGKIVSFIWPQLKNNISFTLNLREICTRNLYTEKNGAGATLKWKRGIYISVCGHYDRKKGFFAWVQQVPFSIAECEIRVLRLKK